MSFHTISCGSKFQRFTTYCIKKLFLLSVLNKPNATLLISLLLLLHDVLNNISTFSSPSAFTFHNSLWYHTSDPWTTELSFNFPSRSSHPITMIIALDLHFTFFKFSMSVLWCVSQKSVHICSSCGCTTPFRYNVCILSCYPHLHDGAQNLTGLFSDHCTLSQRFQTPDNMKPRFHVQLSKPPEII